MNSLPTASDMNIDEIAALLRRAADGSIEELRNRAYEIKCRELGRTVYFRGIVELSNICRKDCYYCGIRRSNVNVQRYNMDEEEILHAARFAYEAGYGSIVLQSGELQYASFVDSIETILQKIRGSSFCDLGITLSLGEQSPDTYRRWFQAGADRYLLRIETSDPELYARMHPADHSFSERLSCLKELREIGYQVGSGFMFGLPGQTYEQMAADLLFLKELDVDMIGMGPYLPHKDTPMGAVLPDMNASEMERLLNLSLAMIAAARIIMPRVNIAATTALQAINHNGREMGILAGANVVMPNVTPTLYRAGYRLYEGKPCLDENESMCRHCLERRISLIGESIAFNQRGDSRRYLERTAHNTSSVD